MSAYQHFVGGAYRSQSPVSANEALINWRIATIETPGAVARTALYPTPGVRTFCTLPSSGGRGAFEAAGRVFVVFGDTLYEILANQTAVSRGTVALDANPVTICTNGDGGGQLFLTSGGHGYCFDLGTNTLTQVLTGDATQGGMLYGYFVAFDQQTSTIRISDLFDGLTWDPTQFAQRTIGADSWRGMLVNPYGYICLPGTKTGEFWYNAGSFPFPFAPDPSGLFEEGIASTFSIKQAAKSIVWLSTNANGGYQVMRATGLSPERISNHALEQQIAIYPDVAEAIGETYEDRGRAVYLLTFPRSKITWVYDFQVNSWYQQGTWLSEQSAYTYWRPVFHCFGFSKHLMADRESNALYEMSDSFGMDIDDRPIRRLRRCPAVTNEDRRVIFDNLRLLVQTGVGDPTGADENTDPQMQMRYSNNFGRTWSTIRTASIGPTGAYDLTVGWYGLGSGKGRLYEVICSTAVPVRITNAFQDVRATRAAA